MPLFTLSARLLLFQNFACDEARLPDVQSISNFAQIIFSSNGTKLGGGVQKILWSKNKVHPNVHAAISVKVLITYAIDSTNSMHCTRGFLAIGISIRCGGEVHRKIEGPSGKQAHATYL